MRTPTVTFFITTGRSGTQWLAAKLSEVYPDLLTVAHEPVAYAYRPKDTLRDPKRLRMLRDDARIGAHLDGIHRTLETHSYVEVGFPAFALAPLLREEFGERLRLVQLTRHPVRVAASLVTHGWYVEGVRPDIKAAVALTPFDAGVLLKQYAARWPDMSAFERGLFFWYEVHSFGIEQEAASDPGTFARFQFESLVENRNAQEELRTFLQLPERPGWRLRHTRAVDRHHRRTAVPIEWQSIHAHPQIIASGERLGYAPEPAGARALDTRYRKTKLMRISERANHVLRRMAGG